MVPEYWELGEDIQDKIRLAGYESTQVEGIAVDIHDLLQAADRIRSELGPAILAADRLGLVDALRNLAAEAEHIKWHCESAIPYLHAAADQLDAIHLSST